MGTKIKAPSLTLEEKMTRVFDALKDGARLTKAGLLERTGMSGAQLTQGWSALRNEPDGHMWVIEPHREHTLYFASSDYQPMLHYMLWQCRRNYWAAVALQTSTEQMATHMNTVAPGNGLVKASVVAMKFQTGAVAGYADLARKIGGELELADDTVEAMLSRRPSKDGASV